MGALLFWMLLLFPFAEVYLLVKVAVRIGFWPTVGLLIFSGILGSYLAKIQGRMAMQRIQACLQQGRMPTRDMIDGVLIFLGALLFAVPGLISDGIGLLFIFPPSRFLIRMLIFAHIQAYLNGGCRKETASDKAPPQFRKPGASQDAEDAQIIE